MTENRAVRRDEAPKSVRVRKRKGDADPFYVAEELIPDGTTYEWKRKSTYGQEDVSHQIHMAENGWEPVSADRMPGYMPAGWRGAVERDGMILMERPVELTEEARAEERRDARAAVLNNESQLHIGPTDTLPRERKETKLKRSHEPHRAVPAE